MSENKKEGDERAFLHDLSTPVASIFLLAEALLEDLQESPQANPDHMARVQKICDSVAKISSMLKERRQALASKGSPHERS